MSENPPKVLWFPAHIQSCQCSTVDCCHAFFPNLPCLSLFFLNLPCCVSFFLSFPCWGPPLLVIAFPPSSFLFLSLLGVRSQLKPMFLQNQTIFTKILNVTAPLYADDSCVSSFLQHLVPLLVISTDPVPVHTEQTFQFQSIFWILKLSW